MKINEEFWLNFQISGTNLDELYNYLLETETPLSKTQIAQFTINNVTSVQSTLAKEERLSGSIEYLPKLQFKTGDELVFPQFGWKKGKVASVRGGHNPEYPTLEVLTANFDSGGSIELAANLPDHKLNEPLVEENNPFLDPQFVVDSYVDIIADRIAISLDRNDDLVCIAGSYFPRALLVDIGIGHLNLCEAVLEMNSGGPLSTLDLIKQIEFPSDVNSQLTEFSVNYALQEDGRFDEVGPTGETLWFLKRLEPEEVQTPPLTLRYAGTAADTSSFPQVFHDLMVDICDELETYSESAPSDSFRVTLSYPHWRAGTLPLMGNLKKLFPTAVETSRIKFDFVDAVTREKIPGWVVRPSRYIFGLRNWYEKQGIIPGSYVTIQKGENNGEVIVKADKSRTNKDWIRTVLVGSDGGVVFTLLKQIISCTYDERMAIMIPDISAIDSIWASPSRAKQPVEKVILSMMRELGKLNPQGQIHAQELYSAVNVIRRVPPSVILETLFTSTWAHHLGDLYFKLNEE